MPRGGQMADFKKIFAEHGYSLFEPESAEAAIIDAIKNKEIRYVLGIPIVLENSEVNYNELIKKAKQAGIIRELLSILFIASQIIKNKEKKLAIKQILKGRKIKKTFDKKDFEQVYAQYSKIPLAAAFSSNLNYWLSFLFAPKQISILYKLKKGERLSKTEREYFSRVIKKKLVAIKELAGFAGELL